MKSNKTSCTPRDHSEERRLQGMLLATPVDDMDDVWVLGGAFLEHFITVLDFDNKRIGFAKTGQAQKWRGPMTPAASQVLHRAVPVSDMDRALPRQEAEEASGGFPWGAAFLIVCLVSMVAGGVNMFRKMRSPKNVTDTQEELEKEPTVDQQAAEEDPDADADAAE